MAGKGVWSKVFQNFIASIRPRQVKGNLMGEDHFQTKYYEIPADPQGGRRKNARWFVPAGKGDFEQELPAEWEAWLRGRRQQVPSNDEVLRSVGIAQLKKINAKQVAINNPFVKEEQDSPVAEAPKYPVYEDYELPDPTKAVKR